jgi:hypothetical protein
MDLSRRSFLHSLGMGAVALTLPKNLGLIEPIIKKVGPPPVNAGFARAIFPNGFHLWQFQWACISPSGFDFKLFKPGKKETTNFMSMYTPPGAQALTYQMHGAYRTMGDAGETFEFWTRAHNPEELAPDVTMWVQGYREDSKGNGIWQNVEVPIKRVRLDHGWALKHGVIRPDEPAATYKEKEEEHDNPENSDFSDS